MLRIQEDWMVVANCRLYRSPLGKKIRIKIKNKVLKLKYCNFTYQNTVMALESYLKFKGRVEG